MAAEKTVSTSFRGSPPFKTMLKVTAARENFSLIDKLENLVFSHCEQRGLNEPA